MGAAGRACATASAIALLGVPAVVMTLAMNGIMEGLTLGLSNGLTCAACASYAPPIVQDGGARTCARHAGGALSSGWS